MKALSREVWDGLWADMSKMEFKLSLNEYCSFVDKSKKEWMDKYGLTLLMVNNARYAVYINRCLKTYGYEVPEEYIKSITWDEVQFDCYALDALKSKREELGCPLVDPKKVLMDKALAWWSGLTDENKEWFKANYHRPNPWRSYLDPFNHYDVADIYQKAIDTVK